MNDKHITIRIPDFCPEDCPEFEISEGKNEYCRTDDGLFYHAEKAYSCYYEGRCRMLYNQLEKLHRDKEYWNTINGERVCVCEKCGEITRVR